MQKIKSFVQRAWSHTAVRFLCVGSFNTGLDLLLLNILVQMFAVPVLIANTFAVLLGITLSYFLNHRIVFRHHQPYSLKSYAQFFLVTGVSVLIIQNVIILSAMQLGIANSDNTRHLLLFDVPDKTVVLNVSKALAIGVGMVWNYLLYRYVIFRNKPDKALEETIAV